MLRSHAQALTRRRSRVFRRLPVYALLILMCLFVFGCARFRSTLNPTDHARLPDGYSLYDDRAPAPDRWWTAFQSGELNRLMDEALRGNLTLRQIYARLSQAELAARQAGAALYPTADLSADMAATRRRRSLETDVAPLDTAARQLGALGALLGGGASATQTDPVLRALQSAQTRIRALETLLAEPPPSHVTVVGHSYSLGLGVRYEVDLWGRLRARREAARLEYAATEEEVYAAMLSLSGLVARQWLTVAARRQELRLVREQRALNQTTLELMEFRFRNGMATALDVYQQRQIVAQTESLLPPLEEGLQAALWELALLMGRLPGEAVSVETEMLPEAPPLPEPGVPADLLARRPDVRAAGLQLQAADWRLGAARADRLPALRISASAAYGPEAWRLLFDNWAATLASGLTAPLYNAGLRRMEIQRVEAVVADRIAAYRQQVLESIHDVEASMMREARQTELVAALRHERDTVQAAHAQARMRYMNGVIDYLPVLSALIQLQALERRLVHAEYGRLERRIQLCLALGGAWMEEEIAFSSPNVRCGGDHDVSCPETEGRQE